LKKRIFYILVAALLIFVFSVTLASCGDDSEKKPIGCKIYVPTASVNAYKSAQYWSDYAAYIEGYDF
jgi:hypothetical protein